eukprot:m.128190 g.128190  ORF g.128190 m.128190 type:complete len:510 (-) comp14558_c1_seq1:803-2332(-)
MLSNTLLFSVLLVTTLQEKEVAVAPGFQQPNCEEELGWSDKNYDLWPGFRAMCLYFTESASDASDTTAVALPHSVLLAKTLVQGETRELRFNSGISAPTSETTAVATNKTAQKAVYSDLKEWINGYWQSDKADQDPTISKSVYRHPLHGVAFFTQDGKPLKSGAEILADIQNVNATAETPFVLYAFENGQFLWPGHYIGYERKVVVNDGHKKQTCTMTTLSLRPLVVSVPDLMTTEEVTHIKEASETRMSRSGVVTMDTDNGAGASARTSSNTFLDPRHSPITTRTNKRSHSLARLPISLGESIQVLRYTPGQRYEAHRDFFNPNDYQRQPQNLKSVDYGARNRLATVFWYISSVENGGETYFPRALNEKGEEYNPWNGDYKDCYRGIWAKATQGNAIIFYSMLPNGALDERSLHGGCPPANNEVKWAANKWIWSHPHKFTGPFPLKSESNADDMAISDASHTKSDCEDSNANCPAWARSGECKKNANYMLNYCKRSCGVCNQIERDEL